jgi:transcriptional regulator with XRE-family HTH domain
MTAMQTQLVLSVSERLNVARKRAGIDQETMAAELNVARQTISLYENGKSEPNLSRLVRWADLTDVSLDWLCGRDLVRPEGFEPPTY